MSAFDQELMGSHPSFLEVINAARIIAATDVTTLIQGETGTGKELLAKAIHRASPRRAGAFRSINCASLQETLADSLLFGHRKGAFTGALSEHPGHVRSADGGSLFLDEIGELPLGTQAKLLRFVESGEYLPVGAVTTIKANVRILAATNRDLALETTEGRFRQDLFFRLNIVPMRLPPLRERSSDVQQLLARFVHGAAKEHRLAAPSFEAGAMTLLRDYDWPGNVRELRNLAERSVILLGGRTIRKENLPVEIRTRSQTANIASAKGFRLPERGIVLDELEGDLIRQALDRTAGNRSRAARLLGITRDTLLYRLRKHAIA